MRLFSAGSAIFADTIDTTCLPSHAHALEQAQALQVMSMLLVAEVA